ncbi:MAG: Hpt domain-containing protein [Planctomycetaceae bacterium]|nr:Hpt domain-containing protein [Planctomycetaceae bacterium]
MNAETAEPIYSIYQDEDDFRELLEEFYTSANERRTTLQQSLATRQLGTIRIHAHQLKGAGGGYGFEGLSQIASELEVACQQPQPDFDEICRRLDQVVDYLGRIRI